MHRARAALTVITSFLRAGESHGLANAIQERRAGIDSKVVVFAINPQRDGESSLNIRPLRVRFALRIAAVVDRRASSHHCRRGSASHGQQKVPPAWIDWIGWIQGFHAVSLVG